MRRTEGRGARTRPFEEAHLQESGYEGGGAEQHHVQRRDLGSLHDIHRRQRRDKLHRNATSALPRHAQHTQHVAAGGRVPVLILAVVTAAAW